MTTSDARKRLAEAKAASEATDDPNGAQSGDSARLAAPSADAPRLRVGAFFEGSAIWLDYGDEFPVLILADYDIPSRAWPLLVAAINAANEDGAA